MATIKYRLGAEGKTHNWAQDEPADPNLSAVNVFDTKCAAIQIEQANVISYTPPIVQVFPDLANAIRRVEAELEARKTGLGGSHHILTSLAATVGMETEAGKYLAELGQDSDEAR